MALSSLVTKNTFTGDGVKDTFNFSFPINSASDLLVYLDGDLQTTSAYTVALNEGNLNGSVTFADIPEEDVVGLIKRNTALDQDEHFENDAPLDAVAIERGLDKVMMALQETNEALARALKAASTTTVDFDYTIPTPEAGKVLVINSDGTGFELVDRLESSGTGTGDATGPNGATENALAFYSDDTGKVLDEIGPGTVGQLLTSNGPSSPPSFQAAPGGGTAAGLLIASNITATARTVPGSGPLSGTYHHFGNVTTGASSFQHQTKIYIKGNLTIGGVLTGVAQSNGGAANGKASVGQAGGGLGGGQAGVYPKGGGSGGGGFVAGGSGSSTVATTGKAGGRPHRSIGMGGSGGGSGAGNGTSVGAAGGGGGPFLYIEVDGNVTINDNILADGAAGSNSAATLLGGAGAGGGGGQVVIRATGTIIGATGKKISVVGGAGGNSYGVSQAAAKGLNGGGGGGGYVELTAGGVITFTGTFAVLATGGAKGTRSFTPKSDAGAGSDGTYDVYQNTTPVSL